MTYIVGDTTVLLGRCVKHITRSVDTIVTTVLVPIAMMLMFVYVFGGAIDIGQIRYVDYLLPGILLVTVASGISYTAFRLFADMSGGIFERFRSMPIARSAVLWAHVFTSLVANLISLAVVGVLLLFTLALTWIAVIPGLTATSVEGAAAFAYPLMFLPFVSSAFVPTDTMPGPVRWFAENQPVTSVVNTLRDLLARRPADDVWTAIAWCAGILVVAYVLAMATYRRKIA